MKKLRYSVAASLLGYIAGPSGDYDWIIMDPANVRFLDNAPTGGLPGVTLVSEDAEETSPNSAADLAKTSGCSALGSRSYLARLTGLDSN